MTLAKISLNSENSKLSPFKNVVFICFNEISLKVMKNAFHFILRALFVVKIFNFCPDFLGHVGKRLDRKGKVNLKIYDVIDWETK